MKNLFAKLIALLLAVTILLGVVACSATENNPVIGKVGKVTITFSQYQSIYQQYAYYHMTGSLGDFDLNNYIKEQLIAYGVTLNRCYVEGIELTAEEEAELDKKVQEKLESSLSSIKVDESITDEQEIYEARLKQFKSNLRKNGTSFNKYMADMKQGLREDMLMEKLKDKVYAEITLADEEVKKYYDENIEKARETYSEKTEDYISKFYEAYSSYIQGDGMIPLFTPENLFSVKHVLVKFEKNVDDPKDGTLSEEAEELNEKTLELIKEGNSTTFAEFEEFVKENNDDPGMSNDAYIEHGYLMHEDLIGKYYDGFGYAAMKLFAGHDWEPTVKGEEDKDKDKEDTDNTADPTATPEATATPAVSPTPTPEPKTYDVEYYTLSDGTEIAAVRSKSGIHYIYIKDILEAGDVDFVDDPENEIWQNIHEFRLLELQQKHYEDRFNEWKAETKIKMKDDYIDQIASRVYGIKTN
ncbi:MAG: hypothetical protein J1E60_02545 [Christensenellaceae bacterium]|nr:hypothetical protein [Christensenellaceae bacterium]